LRERLIAELADLQTANDAAFWAGRSLPLKDTLTGPDAQAVEATFSATITRLDKDEPGRGLVAPEQAKDATPSSQPELQDPPEAEPTHNNTLLPTANEQPRARRAGVAAKTIRLRDKEHRKFVSRHPCLVCGRSPCDPHHVRFAQPRALGRKVSDEFTVPVCRMHHREIHRHGDEAAWWKRAGIEPLAAALTLWRQTHPLAPASGPANAEDVISASPIAGSIPVRRAHSRANVKTNPTALEQ
jgi:hypothetical protein